MKDALTVDELHFIEEISHLISEGGMPRSVAKVLGFMLVCTPEHQSLEAIQRRLHLSAGGASTATTLLKNLELIRPMSFPGDRRIYYRLDPECWDRLLRLRIQQAERGKVIAEQGLHLQPANARIKGMVDLYEKSINLMKQIEL